MPVFKCKLLYVKSYEENARKNMCCYNCMTLFVFSFCCMLDHRIYTSFSKQLLFPNGSWTNCVLILPDVFPHCARGQNVATLGIFCKNCLLLQLASSFVVPALLSRGMPSCRTRATFWTSKVVLSPPKYHVTTSKSQLQAQFSIYKFFKNFTC